MDEEKLEQLYNLLINFATLPCEVTYPMNTCEGCKIYNYCDMLYNLSKGIKGELTIDETVDKIDISYKNIKWEENNNK